MCPVGQMVFDADSARAEDSFVTSLTSFRSPADLITPRWCPQLASLLEVVALRQLAFPEVAPHHRVAVLIDAVGEVLN